MNILDSFTRVLEMWNEFLQQIYNSCQYRFISVMICVCRGILQKEYICAWQSITILYYLFINFLLQNFNTAIEMFLALMTQEHLYYTFVNNIS